MDDLRLTFLIFGILAIIGILVHGLWSIRKNNIANSSRLQSQRNTDTHNDKVDIKQKDGFDEDGVGRVRVIDSIEPLEPIKPHKVNRVHVSTNHANDIEPQHEDPEPKIDEEPISNASEDLSGHVSVANDSFGTDKKLDDLDEEIPVTETDVEAPLYGSVVTQPKPDFMQSKVTKETDNEVPEPPAYLLKEQSTNRPEKQNEEQNLRPELILEPHNRVKENTHSSQSDDGLIEKGNTKKEKVEPLLNSEQIEEVPPEKRGFADHAKRLVSRKRKSVAEKIRKEPKLQTSNANNDDQIRIDFEESKNRRNKQVLQQTQLEEPAQQEVLVLHVRARDEEPIQGAALLPMLLTLGFKFGEQDIFHRHVNTNGKGQVLFSVANMFKPGHFDIDAMETFSTKGLALFMMLPIDGDPQQVFNMMHNAARKISEEFGCDILDGARNKITKQALQKYSEKIRQFERASSQ